MLTWRISHLLALQKKVCSKLTKQIRHGKKHAAFVFITQVPHEIGKCVRYVSVHGSKWASERDSECQCERDERICESAVEPMPHKLIHTMGASNESRLHRTQASIHSSNRMQLRCRIRFDWIHSSCVAGRIRFRFRLASFVSYAFKSDWRQPARDTRQTVKFHIGSLSVIVETRFESDGFS